MINRILISVILFLSQHMAAFPRQADKLPGKNFISLYGRLDNTFYQVKNNRELTVAFLGGSITENPGWRNKVSDYLENKYPQTKFHFIYAGISSLGSLPHAFRLQHDVLDKGKVDLLFVEAAVNDHANKTTPVHQQKAMEGIIRHSFAANPYMNIILMAFADEDKIQEYENGQIPREVALHDQLAAYYHLPFINLAKEVQERIRNKEFTWKDDFKDLHPSPFGQEIYFQAIKTLLHTCDSLYTGKALTKARQIPPKVRGTYYNGKYVNVKSGDHLQGFSVIENWQPRDGAGTRTGFVNVPVLEGTKPGDSFTFSFTGNAVGIAIVSGPDAGIISYSVDGKTAEITDLYTQWSGGLHLPWYLVLGDGLTEGKHVLKIEITKEKNIASKGNACRIVHLLVNE